MRLFWNGFTSWIQDNHSGEVVHLEETLRSIRNLSDNVCQSSFSAVLENASCTHINKLFQTYLNFLRDGNGRLSKFWMSYIEMVEILLGLIRASREGNWMFKQMKANMTYQEAFSQLGQSRDVSADLFQKLQEITCHI